MSIANKKEPKPIPNNKESTWIKVIEDYKEIDGPWYPENKKEEIKNTIINLMNDRDLFGIKKYKTTIQAYNGRDNLNDAFQELLDAVVYLKNECIETNDPATIALYDMTLGLMESTYIKIIMKERRKNESL